MPRTRTAIHRLARIADLKKIGGSLCLDFTNTVDWHAGGSPEERLTSYADLVAWGRHARILTGVRARRLLQRARRRPSDAETVLRRAITMREAIYRIFAALAKQGRPRSEDLNLLNDFLSEALARQRVVPAAGDFAWGWTEQDTALERMLWPVARSAADLLTSKEVRRIGQCADERGCGWLFLDGSKNRSRRWCDMEDCGNRAKARRHIQRYRERRDS